MLLVVTRMTASVGSCTNGSGTSSTRTSRWPCQVTAFMGAASVSANGICSADARQTGAETGPAG